MIKKIRNKKTGKIKIYKKKKKKKPKKKIYNSSKRLA